ncbi:hypothetical protein ACFLQL_04560, partial [Verrucomicrobiota bacterium]
LKKHFPKLKEDKTWGLGLAGAGEESFGHGGGCGTQLTVKPKKHLVFAMMRMNPDDKYKEYKQRAMKLLTDFPA